MTYRYTLILVVFFAWQFFDCCESAPAAIERADTKPAKMAIDAVVPEMSQKKHVSSTTKIQDDDLLLTLEDAQTSKAKVKWGKLGKDVNKATNTVVTAVTTAATDAANGLTSAWEDVTETTAWQATGSWASDAFDSTGDFTTSAWSDVEDLANDIGNTVEDFANSIAQWFQGMQCSLGKDAMQDMLETAFSANPTSLANMKSLYDDADNIKSGATAVAATACLAVWAVLEATNPMTTVFAAMLSTFRSSCPFIAGNNVAVSLGVSLEVGSQAGLWSQGAGVEIGVAYDLNGDKYCYVGGCVSRGITIPPSVDADADTGLVLSLWEKPSCIPGESQAATLGASISLPVGGATLGVDAEVTYVFEKNNIANFYGISISGEGSAGSVNFPAEASVSAALCDAVCVRIDGSSCGASDDGADDTSTDSSGTTSNWAYCADENDTCDFNGEKLVRYGANNVYTYASHSSNVYTWTQYGSYQKCTELISDQISNIASASDCQALAEDDGDTYFAYRQDNEKCQHGSTCTLKTTTGAWNTYSGTLSSGGVSCSNSVFGDPLSGVAKQCYIEVTGDTTGWVECADENDTCSFSGKKVVKYGASSSWEYQLHDSSVSCTNGVFGDPISGTAKSCHVEVPMGTVWTECADENDTCSFSGNKAVRYGADGSYSYQKHSGGVSCTNGVFGDPISGVVKTCSYSDW